MDVHLLTNLQETLSRSTTSEWTYLAEGGAHLVFAYRGTSPLLSNKVLRIRKENIASSSSPSSTTGGSFEVARQYLASSVIPTLVPADLLPSENRLRVQGKWAQQLEEATLDVRPESRLSTPASSVVQGDPIGPDGDGLVEVSLVENLLGGEGDLAIEIKPKCGFLPDPRYLSEASRPVKTKHCRFCMHQAMREAQLGQQNKGTKQRKSSPASGLQSSNPSSPDAPPPNSSRWDYCPLDLFSADRQRRRRAVRELFQSWIATRGTGNNFRIFVSGKAQSPPFGRDSLSTNGSGYPGAGSSTSTASPEGDPSQGEQPVTPGEWNETNRDRLCDTIVDALDRSNALPLLKALQQTFDPVGIEELGRLSRNRGVTMPEGATAFDETLLEDPIIEELDVIRNLWSHTRRDAAATPAQSTAASEREWDGLDRPKLDHTSDLRTLLVSHGISAIFKDCSIVIRFPSALNSSHTETGMTSSLALDPSQAVVKLIDLDFKPLKKANKWYELDDEIWRSHAERLAGDEGDRGDHPRFSRDCCR